MKYSDLTRLQLFVLEGIIQKVIKNNVCPYTTNSDIRYFETEEYLKAVSNEN